MGGIFRKKYMLDKREINVSFKSKIKNCSRLVTDTDFRQCFFSKLGFAKWISDEKFLLARYKTEMGRELNLTNPTTYTEKLQWLKVYDHRPEYTTMVDKYAVKKYVANKIGEEYVIPLIGVWEKVEDIDFSSLPDRFVLKVSHDSGGIVICKDKSQLDIVQTKKYLKKLLKRNYYCGTREWPYKNVKPRIIAEEYMEDSYLGELRDYKFFTFGGVPKVVYIAQGRGNREATVADFYDMEFNHLPFTIDHDMAEIPPEKPVNFELMQQLATKLSEGTPQLRVDFYEVEGKVYFGEMTFFHCSGWAPFHPEEWDKTFGDWVVIPKNE